MTPLERAISYLTCVKCRGNLHLLEEHLTCAGCREEYRIVDGNIFVFSEVKISDEVLEKTMYGPEYDELITQIPMMNASPIKETAALDYGCGSSLKVFNLAGTDCMETVFGLDYDLAPLRIVSRAAKEKAYGQIFLIQYDREDLPFKEDAFDLITSHQAFEHVPDPGQVVSELARRMKGDAQMRVDFPNGHSIGECARELFHRLNRTQNPHISKISYKKAKAFFSDAGLQVVSFESTYALRGPLVYFIEGFVLRFLFRKHKIYSVRDSYRNSWWFRFFGRIEKHISRLFPQIGQAFVFVLRKPSGP